MSKFLFSNNAVTTLAAGISAVDTTVTVAGGSGALFPTTGTNKFNLTIIRQSDGFYEIVQVTTRSSDTFTVVRAQEGTTGLVFVTGDRVELRATAAGLNSMLQVDDLTAAIGTISGITKGNGANKLTAATGSDVVTLINGVTQDYGTLT